MKNSLVYNLSLWLTLAVIANVIITVVATFSTAAQVQLLDSARFGSSIPLAQIQANDDRQRLFAGLQMGSELLCWLFFFPWIYQANRNARSLGAKDMQYGPTWAVLWFFIPLANLVMPYLVMREIWKASNPNIQGKWRATFVSPILFVWWFSVILNCFLHYEPLATFVGLRRLSNFLSTTNVDWLWEYSWGLLFWYVLSFSCSVLLAVTILNITGLQNRKWEMIEHYK